MSKSVLALIIAALTTLSGPPRAVDEIPSGAISGTVTLEPPPPPRRTANRYPGTPAASRVEQAVSPIVYLRGAIPGPPPPGYTANPEVLQRDTAFVPSSVVIQVGATVSFPNGDPFFHNVFAYSEARTFDLGRYPEGVSKDVTFDEPGIVELFCEVHDFMRGVVVVAENPYHAVVDADGAFTISGVPAGTYTLVAWHPDYETVEQSVTVTDGGTAQIEVELPL